MNIVDSLPLGFIGFAVFPAMFGLMVVGGLLWMIFGGIKFPMLWVILSIPLLMGGIGCFVYGIADFIALFAHRGPTDHPSSYDIECAAAFVGGGAGAAVGGIVLLVVALMRQRKKTGPGVQT